MDNNDIGRIVAPTAATADRFPDGGDTLTSDFASACVTIR
jgi:hypothetical protein